MVHFSTVGGSAPAIASAGSQIGSRGNNVADAARSLALHEKRKLRITGASCSLKFLFNMSCCVKRGCYKVMTFPRLCGATGEAFGGKLKRVGSFALFQESKSNAPPLLAVSV
jgi:hypothetical protein